MEKNYKIPSVTMNERPDGYDLEFVISGVSKSEADLSVEGRTVMLKTQMKRQPPAGFRCVASEFDHADYAVSVDLPELADPSTLKASLANGILAVSVAKRPESQVRKLEIS